MQFISLSNELLKINLHFSSKSKNISKNEYVNVKFVIFIFDPVVLTKLLIVKFWQSKLSNVKLAFLAILKTIRSELELLNELFLMGLYSCILKVFIVKLMFV